MNIGENNLCSESVEKVGERSKTSSGVSKEDGYSEVAGLEFVIVDGDAQYNKIEYFFF